MNDFDRVEAIWLVGALILVVSSLSLRQVRLAHVGRAIVGWTAIGLVVALIVLNRHAIAGVFGMTVH